MQDFLLAAEASKVRIYIEAAHETLSVPLQYLICLTLKWTVGTTLSLLVAVVSSSLLVGTVVSRLL